MRTRFPRFGGFSVCTRFHVRIFRPRATPLKLDDRTSVICFGLFKRLRRAAGRGVVHRNKYRHRVCLVCSTVHLPLRVRASFRMRYIVGFSAYNVCCHENRLRTAERCSETNYMDVRRTRRRRPVHPDDIIVYGALGTFFFRIDCRDAFWVMALFKNKLHKRSGLPAAVRARRARPFWFERSKHSWGILRRQTLIVTDRMRRSKGATLWKRIIIIIIIITVVSC